MFDIDADIPVPTSRGARSKFTKTALALNVGESFFVAGAKIVGIHADLGTAKRHGYKFTARSVDGGVRIWRIE